MCSHTELLIFVYADFWRNKWFHFILTVDIFPYHPPVLAWLVTRQPLPLPSLFVDNSHSLTYLLTYSTQHSPSWEANRFASSQEIPRVLRNAKVYSRIHKCPSPVCILNQLNPFHTPTSHFLKIHLNIILPFTPGFTEWSLSLSFPTKPCNTSPLSHTRYRSRLSHSSRFYHPDNSGRAVQIIKLFSLCRFLHSPVTSSVQGPNISLNILFWNTHSLRSSLNFSDQVSHP
jgi:hypothetical protein